MVARPVAGALQLENLLRGKAEEEEVIGPHLVADLDVCAVERADGQGAVQGELHVACTARLFAGGGDLLREIGCREDPLRERNAVVGEEHDAQLAVDLRVRVDHRAHRVDQLDDQLRRCVGGRRLPAEDERARDHGQVRVLLRPQVERNHVQEIEQLALVFVHALDLHVEERVAIDVHAVLRFDVPGELVLVPLLDRAHLGAEGGVFGVRGQLLELLELRDPPVPDTAGDGVRQEGIRGQQPAAGSYAVGDVVEAVREHLVEVVHQVGLEQLGVQGGDPIDAVRTDHRQVGHADALAVRGPVPVVDQRHAREARIVERVAALHLAEETPVDLVDDGEVARQQALEQLHRPGLQRLRQQRVVGVAEGRLRHLPGLVPGDGVLVDQDAQQLGDGDGGVGIVELDGDLLGEVLQ